jgi:hypothetical protein
MSNGVLVVLLLLGTCFSLYVAVTLAEWILVGDGRSLRDVLKAQWKHLSSLRF